MTSRFSQRYPGADRRPDRQCSTPTCSRNVTTSLSGRCWKCANNLRRHAAPLQECPQDSELAPYVRRAETQRGRYKHLDLDVLEAQYRAVVDSCRGRATPSFKEHGKLSFQVHDREACALIRDISEGEGMSFTRCLDLMTGLHLARIERPRMFVSDEAFLAVTVAVFRRVAGVGRRWGKVRADSSQASYRKEISLPSRLASGRYLNQALGAIAVALATREAKREEQERDTRHSYYQAVQAIAAE
jgi:hypothetical protein